MIIKNMDSKQEEAAELETYLKSRLTSYQRWLIQRGFALTKLDNIQMG
jgi:hypothetical protein